MRNDATPNVKTLATSFLKILRRWRVCEPLEDGDSNGVDIFSAPRDRYGVAARFVVIIRLHGTGGVQDISKWALHSDIHREPRDARARYVIPANYLLGYFYIQYIRE